ncbi:caspase family domain containing protein [Psychroflexus torquis ATCC 700755]|uniref:Caspase family domain containing protein n=1 Tax=Psychroflexus torquis (strain ATCC 700755 / CIP 106069 / ACAM 623) TaxID=313595 RepID=K4IRT2_PSYTT|nr:caspase family protein [Psychroflexus torquis]AFU68180.1 caspase family domain containing protein [Psychroflexus torquis ATCC 700755]
MKLFCLIIFLISTQSYSQEQKNIALYDVNKVYIQLNELNNRELVSSSNKLLLFKGEHNFSIWSARDQRKMYKFFLEGEEIKAILNPNSKNIIFFLKKNGKELTFVGILDVKSGIYKEKEIQNKEFTPLNFKTTFKFNSENGNVYIFSNNKLWNFNLQKIHLLKTLSLNKNLEDSYKDILSISKNSICFKIESDKKYSYFNTQLQPSKWKLDSVMLFHKTTKKLSKISLKENAIGAYSHSGNKIIIDYKNKISSLDILNLEQKSYPKKEDFRVYKSFTENEKTLLMIGHKDLEKIKEANYNSLYKAFKKSKEENFDMYLYSRKLSSFNLLQIDKINSNFEYEKGNLKLPFRFDWNPGENYFITNHGIVYNRINGVFSYYPEVDKSQRWSLDYTREYLKTHEGLTLSNKGDFTFYGYDGLEIMNVTNEREVEEKANFKLTEFYFLQNQNVLAAYIRKEKKKNLIQLELKNEKGDIIWKSEFIDSKIKEEINVGIYLNHNQTHAFLDISPLYYDENNKSYSYLIDLETKKISKFKYNLGAYFTESFSYINGINGDYFIISDIYSKKEQKVKNTAFLATLKNDNIIYKENNKEGAVLKGKVTGNGIVSNFKYNLPKEAKFQFNSSPFSFIKSKNLLAGVHNQELLFWKLDDENSVKKIKLNYDSATYLTSSEKQLFVYYKNGFIDVVDLESLEIIASFTIHKKNENVYKAFFNDDLKFFIPKEIIREYHFVKDFETFPLVSYELFLNRPDIILSKLGYTKPKLIDVYKKAFLKRLAYSGYSEKTDYLAIVKPQISLLNRDAITSISKTNGVSLNLETEVKLDSLLVYINGVPVLKKKPIQNIFKESITLSNGINKITVLGINKEGVKSEPLNLEVTYENNEKPTVYYFGIGVSKYLDATMNLKFADKDVRSLSKLFKSKFEGRIHIDTLNNLNATKENILAFKEQLKNTNINDIVIISFSGHGLVDDANDFYFATHDIDFDKPNIKGVSYADIQQLVEGIPARKKLLLIDACHSGELDAEEINKTEIKVENVTSYIPKGAKGSIIKSNKSGFKTSFEIMKSSFNNSDRGNGSFVISAAGGKEYAFESEKWGNGVFTYSFIKAMEELTLDKFNNKQSIKISMLKDYIYQSVKKLTNNQQKPTSRSENLELDWVLFD